MDLLTNDVNVICILGGLFFILIAIVGGGFSIKEITIPKVPKWTRVISFFVGLGLVYISIFPLPLQPPETGSISVSSTPSGASIYLDGNYKGTTPMTIEKVKEGSYTITLKYPEYQDWSQTIHIEVDKKTPVSPTLTSTSTPSDCFPEVPRNRTRIMEEGTRDFELIGPLELKDEPIVINFTENNKPIGYIKLFFISNNQIFKIEKITDSKCQQIEEYSNIDRGGDKNVLQNADSVQMQFGDYKYVLRLIYGDGTIDANFVRTV